MQEDLCHWLFAIIKKTLLNNVRFKNVYKVSHDRHTRHARDNYNLL